MVEIEDFHFSFRSALQPLHHPSFNFDHLRSTFHSLKLRTIHSIIFGSSMAQERGFGSRVLLCKVS